MLRHGGRISIFYGVFESLSLAISGVGLPVSHKTLISEHKKTRQNIAGFEGVDVNRAFC